jgi:hypothetical protein
MIGFRAACHLLCYSTSRTGKWVSIRSMVCKSKVPAIVQSRTARLVCVAWIDLTQCWRDSMIPRTEPSHGVDFVEERQVGIEIPGRDSSPSLKLRHAVLRWAYKLLPNAAWR